MLQRNNTKPWSGQNNSKSGPSYTETQMSNPDVRKRDFLIKVNWDWELLQLKREPNDRSRWSRLKVAASSWVTCAVGSQCDIIPRDATGLPEDKELALLGVQFNTAIHQSRLADARHLLNEIEKRSRHLLGAITPANQ